MTKLLLVLVLGCALASGLAHSRSEPPLLIDSPASPANVAS